jgi:choline dehydrogenase-like flavoprotein
MLTVTNRYLPNRHHLPVAACRRSSVCDASGQCWQVAGLYIADASLFPTPSGVNPMITIYGLAHLVGTGIAQRWKAAKKAQEASCKQ